MKIVNLRNVVFAGALVVLGALLVTPNLTVRAADDESELKTHIQLSPTKDRQELKPGQQFEGSFNIYNRGTEPFDFKVYVRPLTINENCTENYEIPSDYTKMTEWVNLERNNYYNLKPEEVQNVKFTIDVPKNAPAGGQYVVIFAETGKIDSSGNMAINVNERVGYKFYADLGGQNREAGQVVSVKQGAWFWEPPINGYSEVRNSGNVDFAETYTYTITGLTGKKVYEHAQTEDVLPETCRRIRQEWKQTPAFGVFWVENKINFLNKEQFKEKKLVIVIPIYIVVIFSIVIALLIWALVTKIKSNRVKFNTGKG